MNKIESLTVPPDFEVRANEFINRIELLIPEFPNMVIVPKNKTLSDLVSGPNRIDWMEREYPEFVGAERLRDRETEIESSYMNSVVVAIGSNSKQELYDFARRADLLAKDLDGTKRQGMPFKDHQESDYLFRFDGELFYDFD